VPNYTASISGRTKFLWTSAQQSKISHPPPIYHEKRSILKCWNLVPNFTASNSGRTKFFMNLGPTVWNLTSTSNIYWKSKYFQVLEFSTNYTASNGGRPSLNKGKIKGHPIAGHREGVGGQHHAPVVLPLGKTRYPLYRRLGGPQGRSGYGAKNLAPTMIQSPDRPARSQSPYWMNYPAHT
jgi:hypothetical protein